MNKIKKLTPVFTAIITAVVVSLLIRLVENTFNLDIDPLLRILIIGLSATIASSIVAVKLAETKKGEKNQVKISPLSLIPGMIPGIIMIAVAAVPVVWILNLGAEWSVVRLGALAWIILVALKFAWAIPMNKPILNFLKSKLPPKLSGPISWSYIGLLTGIFECGIALAFVLKFDILYQASWVDILAFGIGFGAIEALVLGLVSLGQIVQYMLRPESIPEEYTKEENRKVTSNDLLMLPVAPVERASTLCIHVFSNVLIILAVQQNIYLLFWGDVPMSV
jgi:uncharacterized membrane protein YhfC